MAQAFTVWVDFVAVGGTLQSFNVPYFEYRQTTSVELFKESDLKLKFLDLVWDFLNEHVGRTPKEVIGDQVKHAVALKHRV